MRGIPSGHALCGLTAAVYAREDGIAEVGAGGDHPSLLRDLRVFPGDKAAGDEAGMTERAEVVDMVSVPSGPVRCMAATFILVGPMPAGSGTVTLDRERYTNVVGDNSGLSLDFYPYLHHEKLLRTRAR